MTTQLPARSLHTLASAALLAALASACGSWYHARTPQAPEPPPPAEEAASTQQAQEAPRGESVYAVTQMAGRTFLVVGDVPDTAVPPTPGETLSLEGGERVLIVRGARAEGSRYTAVGPTGSCVARTSSEVFLRARRGAMKAIEVSGCAVRLGAPAVAASGFHAMPRWSWPALTAEIADDKGAVAQYVGALQDVPTPATHRERSLGLYQVPGLPLEIVATTAAKAPGGPEAFARCREARTGRTVRLVSEGRVVAAPAFLGRMGAARIGQRLFLVSSSPAADRLELLELDAAGSIVHSLAADLPSRPTTRCGRLARR